MINWTPQDQISLSISLKAQWDYLETVDCAFERIYNSRNEREMASVRAGRDRSAGMAHGSHGHEGSIPSVPTDFAMDRVMNLSSDGKADHLDVPRPDERPMKKPQKPRTAVVEGRANSESSDSPAQAGNVGNDKVPSAFSSKQNLQRVPSLSESNAIEGNVDRAAERPTNSSTDFETNP